jgi:outer membrane protein assembly factor BamB
VHPRRIAGCLAAACVLAACAGPTGGAGAGTAAEPLSVVVAAQLPWRLPAAVSRSVVLPAGSDLLVAGGLTAAQTSATGVVLLDPASGQLTSQGSLAAPTHDAAGAQIGGTGFVFGGGAASTVATVQQLRPGGTASTAASLPQPRSDLSAVRSGRTVYLLGGYDGARLLPQVLATTDGRTFRTVARLPVPVRYAALAAADGSLWVFGGLDAAGADVTAIQRVDPARHSAKVVGHLPVPLAGAAAANLGGLVVLAGGVSNGAAQAAVYQLDRNHGRVREVAQLPTPVSNAGAAVLGDSLYLVGGEDPNPVDVVQRISALTTSQAHALLPAVPFDGRLLIADRGNNRLLVVDADKRILWTYPAPGRPAPAGGFYFPDDAFFVRHGSGIITNEEGNDTIVELGFPSGRVSWSYGHPRVPGSAPGYLSQPDDAYLLRNGLVTVADAMNCRILFLRPGRLAPVHVLGTTGRCVHHPPAEVDYPNGDTPLADGNVLVSEVNGSWVTELTPTGRLVWTVHLPIAYPSDPQQLGPDLYLVADYASPGGLYEFDRAGHILWRYDVPSGPGALNHPSLAERLPNGLICVNDDYNDRVVIIAPFTGAIVWQYGQTGRPGTAPGLLSIPDGFDLLAPNGTTPTHPTTG